MRNLPLEVLNKLNAKEELRVIGEVYKDPRAKWDKKVCYCPVALGCGCATEITHLEDLDAADYGSKLAVLASWRAGKTIYDIDQELSRTFLENSREDIDIETEFLKIPEFCIYIRPNAFQDVDGFFVMIDDDVTRHNKELYIKPLNNKGEFVGSLYAVLPDAKEKLNTIIDRQVDEWKQYGLNMEQIVSHFSTTALVIRYVVNVLLYLSAVNAEVIQTNTKSFKRTPKIKDRPREIKQYKVGEKTGIKIKTLRNSVRYEKNEGGGHHRSPTVHIRRAHYHTYLVGKGRAERKIKWLSPIIVNGEEVETTTVTKVKKV